MLESVLRLTCVCGDTRPGAVLVITAVHSQGLQV